MTTPNLVLLQGAQAGDGGMVSMLIMMGIHSNPSTTTATVAIRPANT